MNEQLFRQTDEDELHFKRQFAIQFLASWSAIYYADHYLKGYTKGMPEELKTPPAVNAVRLAQKAWDYWCFVKP